MRGSVPLRCSDDGEEWVMRLTPSQLALLRQSVVAFQKLVPSALQRTFVLGVEGESLGVLYAVGEEPDTSVHIPVTKGQLTATHALLVTLLALVPSERSFMRETGFFRENVNTVANGLRKSFAKAVEVG